MSRNNRNKQMVDDGNGGLISRYQKYVVLVLVVCAIIFIKNLMNFQLNLQGVLVVILNKSTMTPCEQMDCRPTTTPPYPPTSVKSDFYIHIFEKYLSFLMYILYLQQYSGTGPLTSLEDGDSLFPTKVKVCKRDFSIFEM